MKLLYIHGMGGGADSRIPSILAESLSDKGIDVVVRTYDFDPEKGAEQIRHWVDELEPSMMVGESLGSLHALRLNGVPRVLVSPSLNAPLYFSALAWLALIPGVTRLFDRIYRPKAGDRQPLHFTYDVLKKYRAHRKLALDASASSGKNDQLFAFFGIHDHYRRSGIVSIRTWKKYFGNSFQTYDGTHFMEEDYVRTILVDKICNMLIK